MKVNTRNLAAISALSLLASGALQGARAESDASGPAPLVAGEDTIIVTGTREAGRKAQDSATPIQVIGAEALAATGQTNILDALQRLSPSFSNQWVTPSNFRAFSLDGLSPNQTLVLINGKRRHLSSQLFKNANPYQGSDPVDLDLIPLSAIDHIELLRDGAAAQYGTDAIAGVINIILKSGSEGGTASVLGGLTAKGDGGTAELGADDGFGLDNGGFVHLSGDYRHHDFTNRSGLDPRTNYTVRGKQSGDAAYDLETVAVNAEQPVGDDVTLYGFGTFAHRGSDAEQTYRLGTTAPKVWPNGFFPLYGDDEYDFDLTGGAKGRAFGWDWDVSTSFGRDESQLNTHDTFNPSLYASTGDAQTSFYDGAYIASQLVTDLDLKRGVDTGLWTAPLTIAVGLEHRYETYELDAGEPASFLLGGGQGVAGFATATASNSSRNVVAGYADLSTFLTPVWQADLAGRVEHYDDVGSGATGKLSSRYDFSKLLGIRGSVGNGYHAPTLAQEHYASSSMSTTSGSGILPVDSVGARLLGAPALKPETSINYSAGLVSEPLDHLHVTLDAYQIDIDDRIISTGNLYGARALQALAANGNTLPYGIAPSNFSATYFTNGADTRTRGLDLDVDYRTDLGDLGAVKWDLGGNYNTTKISNYHQAPSVLRAAGVSLFNPASISYLTTATPKTKVILSGTYFKDRWEVTLRETHYGDSSEEIDPIGNGAHFYRQWAAPAFITDIDVSYAITSSLKATIGADNAFNKMPARVATNTTGTSNIQIYPTFTPYGFNGGYYYTRLTLSY